ncbi:hypothetical protein ACFYZJ_34890 [Streptomyces sp. NPDC001848]|uniref:hypothetical protein n=1 Tax=Streptomyces sp. NPDC001848 TaxID=3364618 RepID=UPI0036C7CA9A
MTHRISRHPGTPARTNTPTAAPGFDRPARRLPGDEALRVTLGEDGPHLLDRQSRERGTALGELADLVLKTAHEADRLHGKLHRHAAHVRARLDDALDPHLDPAFVPVTGLLTSTGHTTDLHAARFAQQMSQLALALESYQAAVLHTGSVTSRS